MKLSEKRFHADSRVEYREEVFFPDKLTAQSEAAIARGLADWVQTGRYTGPVGDQTNNSQRVFSRSYPDIKWQGKWQGSRETQTACGVRRVVRQAQSLDAAEEVTHRMDNLAVAREMREARREYAQLERAYKFATEGEPVVRLTRDEFQKDGVKLTEKVPAFYREKFGGAVTHPELGEVKLDLEGVRDSLGHGVGSLKAAAFAAVPEVIRNGFIFSRETNWKGCGYDTAVMVAPITIDGERYVCEVVVKRGKKRQGYYLHEVEIQKGLEEAFKTANGSAPQARTSRLILSARMGKVKEILQADAQAGEPAGNSEGLPSSTKTSGAMFARGHSGQSGTLAVDAAQVRRAPPKETRAQWLQRKFQDKLNRFTVIRKWLESQGVKLTEQANVYGAEERMHGRFANKFEDFQNKRVRPLVEKITRAGGNRRQAVRCAGTREDRTGRQPPVCAPRLDTRKAPHGRGVRDRRCCIRRWEAIRCLTRGSDGECGAAHLRCQADGEGLRARAKERGWLLYP